MKNLVSETILVTSATVFLGACGGGDTDGVMGTSSVNLIGVNAETGANARVVSLLQTTAVTDSEIGLRADFDGYFFDANSGFENGSAVENGNTIGLLTELDLPPQTDLRLFDGAYDAGNGVVAIYYGISGIKPSDALPSSDTATWTGIGFANLISATGTSNLGTGSAKVTANFAGTMTAEISGLTGAVDGINIPNLEISGDRFSGATIQTLSSGTSIDAVGANAIANVEGVLSGPQNATGVPDEVGGLFSLTGDDATLVGGFVAD